MQTFLPYPSFIESARCLDYRRLGKQRVEAKQILSILNHLDNGETGVAWSNHPAVRMWRGYRGCLAIYYNAVLAEWVMRGYKNSMVMERTETIFPIPSWLGDDAFHDAHKSNLLRKEPKFYRGYGWNVKNDLPYIWPV